MKRRDFLRTGISAAAALSISPALLKAIASNDPLHDFGIISGVVTKELQADPEATLRLLADMGYKYFEFGGSFGMKPNKAKRLLKSIGLTPLAGGTSINAFKGDGLQKLIDEQLEMDKKYLVCYWPWRDGGDKPDMEDLNFALKEFHRIGKACNDNGLRFAFHNHDKEFKKVDGEVIYDYFMRNTDPELLTMEFDLYWAFVGGVDPADYIQKYPGRYELLHVKDCYDRSDRESFACVGSGIIDFEPIFKLRDIGGFKHLIVEKDHADPGLECAKTSIDHLKTLQF